MPDVFTPNTDNLNDVFSWKGNMKFRSYEFAIYNRWGMKLFETKDPAAGWDGNVSGKRAQDGVYVYRMSGVDTNGKRHSWKGTFTLLY
jgi:gliding motility-associated-like protein